MKWMYDPDPFAARKEVAERQAKATRKREESAAVSKVSQASHQYAHQPEVKMSSELRDMVEDAVKQVSWGQPDQRQR